jgi:hypothetical protein
LEEALPMTTHYHDRQHAALIDLLCAIPAQPIETRNPLALLRPLFDGTMTIETALLPTIQEAIAACEQLAYQRDGRGRSLCNRLGELRPIPAPHAINGW